MSTAKRLVRFKHACCGTTVIEFALVLPVFIAMVVGGLYACLGLFTAASLQYAVERGARCASVDGDECGSPSSTETYAAASYYGPHTPAPSFSYSLLSCGYDVSGTVNFVFDFGLKRVTTPITASACFP